MVIKLPFINLNSELDELFENKDWQAFAIMFLELYSKATDEQQLKYVRALTTKWRNNTLYSLLGPSL